MPTFAHPDPQLQPEFYADVPMKRLFAWMIDTVLVTLAVLLIVPLTAFTGLFILPFLILLVSFAYRVITLANGSATLGMRLLAIEFVDARGRPFDLQHALFHTLGYTLSWAALPVQLLSMILMASSERGQGLTDMLLGTLVLNRRAR